MDEQKFNDKDNISTKVDEDLPKSSSPSVVSTTPKSEESRPRTSKNLSEDSEKYEEIKYNEFLEVWLQEQSRTVEAEKEAAETEKQGL